MPVRVNREGSRSCGRKWRVVDRWWTEEPLDRRYFDLVLEVGPERVRLPRRGSRLLVQPAGLSAWAASESHSASCAYGTTTHSLNGRPFPPGSKKCAPSSASPARASPGR